MRQGDASWLHVSAAMAWNYREELLEQMGKCWAMCADLHKQCATASCAKCCAQCAGLYAVCDQLSKLCLRIMWLLASQCLGSGTTPACVTFFVFQAVKVPESESLVRR